MATKKAQQVVETPDTAAMVPADLASALHIFSGNIMYIKDGPTKNNNEYLTVAVRYQDNDRIMLSEDSDAVNKDAVPTQLYLPIGTIESLELKVGDMIAFAATRLVEGRMQMANGDVLHQARGFQANSVQVVIAAKKSAATQVAGEASEGLKTQFAKIAGNLANFLGI